MSINQEPDQATAPDEILHPGSRTLFRYWEALRKERPAPFRSEIDLKPIAALVPALALLERHRARQQYTWRLAGTRICEVWGVPLTGTIAFEDWPEFDRCTVNRLLDTVVGSLQPGVARFKATNPDHDAVGIELLAVPAIVDGASHAHALCTVLPFREPDWLGTCPLGGFELSSVRTIWTEMSPAMPLGSRPQTAQGSPNRSFLRVIRGGLDG